MRWLAVAISVAAFGLPTQAADLAPLDDGLLATMTGGAAAAVELGASAEAEAQSVDLTATSTLQASISQSASHLGGVLRTGDIALGEASAAMGGVNSVQLATGTNDIQQNSVALALAF